MAGEKKPPIDPHVKAVLDHRAEMQRGRTIEERRLAKHKRWLDERHKERSWPLDARTGERAEVDPEDVNAPLDFEIKELTAEDIEAASQAPTEFGKNIDENLMASRRIERDKELAARAKVQGDRWTDELVEARIEEAFKVLNRVAAGPVGPRAFGNGMPTPIREMSDLVAQAGNKSLRKAMKRLLRNEGPPTGNEVTRMNDALGWAVRYLKSEEPDLALFLNLGGMWKAWGAPVSRKCKEIGVHRQVFYRDRKKAVRAIVEGLIRDGRAPT